MNGKQLKNSILQWAIQGKLVPQIASEGTAEDLLKEIRAEKEKLVKEGKLKKKDLEVKPIEDDEIPFEIPEGWRWVKLKDIVSLITKGSSPSWQGVKYVETGILFITSENVRNGFLDLSMPKYLDPKFNELQSRSILRKGDLLTNIVGASIGRTAEYNLELEDCNINQAVAIIRLLHKSLNPYFLLILNSPFIIGQMIGKTVDTARANISLGSVENLCIPLPPLAEQKRIVAKIEELMPLVEQYGKAQEQLEALNKELPETLKKSVLQEAIMGKLVPQDPKEGTADELLAEIRKEKEKLVKEGKLKKKDLEVKPIEEDEVPFEVPEGWRWCRLGNLGITETGTTPSKAHPEYFGSYIPFLGPANILDNRIVSETQGLSEIGVIYGRVVPSRTILQVCIGGSIGKCAVVDKEVTFNQQINSITAIKCEVRYLYYVLQSETFRLEIMEKSTGTATPIINRGNWEDLLVPVPPLAEQKRIVAKIEEVMGKIEGMKR